MLFFPSLLWNINCQRISRSTYGNIQKTSWTCLVQIVVWHKSMSPSRMEISLYIEFLTTLTNSTLATILVPLVISQTIIWADVGKKHYKLMFLLVSRITIQQLIRRNIFNKEINDKLYLQILKHSKLKALWTTITTPNSQVAKPVVLGNMWPEKAWSIRRRLKLQYTRWQSVQEKKQTNTVLLRNWHYLYSERLNNRQL